MLILVLSVLCCKKEQADMIFQLTLINGETLQVEKDVEVNLSYITKISGRNTFVNYKNGVTDVNGRVAFILDKNIDRYYYNCVIDCMTLKYSGYVDISKNKINTTIKTQDTLHNTGYLKFHQTISDYFYYYIYDSIDNSSISGSGIMGVWQISPGHHVFNCYADKSEHPDSIYSFFKTYDVFVNPCDTVTIDVP